MQKSRINFSCERPRATHLVSVRSATGPKRDSKTFSINAVGVTSHEICELIEEFKEKYFHKLFEQNVVFNDDIQVQRTHEIVIMPKNSEDKSKSFSVKLPSHSSEEISEVLKAYLYGTPEEEILNGKK